MHGVKKVALFCCLITILPAILIILPLYLRHSKYADVSYSVAESDIMEIRDGISTIFCQEHSLTMNTSFNAFQLKQKPEISKNRKHIRLKKSMTLPDDTLEYWGFYLLRGATVALKVCSSFQGSKILVVKGERNLKTCGLLDPNKHKKNASVATNHGQVLVSFESPAEDIIKESTTPIMLTTEKIGSPINDFTTENTLKASPSIATTGDIIINKEDDPLAKKVDKEKITTPKVDEIKKVSSEKPFNIKYNDELSESETDNILASDKNQLDEDKLLSIEAERLKKTAENYIKKHQKSRLAETLLELKGEKEFTNDQKLKRNSKEILKTDNKISNKAFNVVDISSSDEVIDPRKSSSEHGNKYEPNKRHNRRRNRQKLNSTTFFDYKTENVENSSALPVIVERKIRPQRDLILERKINHGGTAINSTERPADSLSSFERNLLRCYDGQILLAQTFPPSSQCVDVKYLEVGNHMITTHEVVSDGYYYYIFYNVNDLIQNDIHTIFDIYKPTFQYSNAPETRGCINSTSCTFPVHFLSDETVVVEVPTKDGIENEDDDISTLISTCHPRMAIYVIFPITVLFLILTCAFL